ncbi:MAG: response regulator transcription factor [Richelia sp. RM2_1_2]|nr:response regulator transcription factor [Richelia sp. SM2_1_7]NJM18815.1 response regulator transcription factor [Richelia sp. SM1_7_0]NJN09997.1 response regulator transcription factor [Richelia sp. RM1_1_1]NJO30367.1 response regulator transcription factor [Richelia sp. SL_2_1]NJO64188.1 response regulator transcription factor [Richelia sp. RM2_1_2]
MQKFLIVDDHHLIISGTLNMLHKQYPDTEILIAKTAEEALEKIEEIHKENSLFDLIVLDLSIPQKTGMIANIDTGIQLIKDLLNKYPDLNFMVQSSYTKALVRIKYEIDEHQGGFVIADKGLSEQEILTRVNLAIQGATHTKDIKTGLELKPEWLEVLSLAFEEGLQDKVISEKMHLHERTVRTYWTKIQDALNVYPEDCKQEGKNMRIQTEIRAREEGLLD